MVCSLLWVSVGLRRFVVFVLLVELFVLISICVLLINRMIGLVDDLILLIMFFRWFLNLFFILVFVCSMFKLSLISLIFLSMFGILFFVILMVRFLIIVVLLMLGLFM